MSTKKQRICVCLACVPVLFAAGFIGCGLDHPGRPPTSEFFGTLGYFRVLPNVTCANDSVNVTWRVITQNNDGQPIVVNLRSIPTNLFVGAGGVDPETHSGTRTFQPTRNTTFLLTAGLAPLSAAPESRDVIVVQPGEIGTTSFTMAWGCTNGFGNTPGWAPIRFEAGEFASANVEVMGVTNTSMFPIRLGLARDGDASSTISVEMATGDSTPAFNGLLDVGHLWDGVPNPPNRVRVPSCTVVPPEPPTGGGTTIDMTFPVPPITFEIQLRCIKP